MKKIKPKLVLETGSMFSGKTTALQSKGKRHRLAKNKTIFIKPDIDNRYSNDEIVTHEGIGVPSINVRVDASILNHVAVLNAEVVLIDEVQFFEEQILMDIDKLLKMGKIVYCAGLDLQYTGNPFIVTMKIMAIADKVNKHKAVCSDCGEDAYISHKKVQNDKVVELGSQELYEALCRSCYYEKNNENHVSAKIV